MKFSFDDYVKENVRLDPNLQSDLTEELRESRRLCLKEFIFKCGSEDDVLAPEKKPCNGIRLGSGFIKKTITLEEFTLSRHNLQLLKGVEETLKMKVEEGLNNLIAHFTDYYMNGEENREMERYLGSFHTPYDKLSGCLKRDIVFQLYSALDLGKLDRFQDGSRMIWICLRRNPSDAAWHPTSMQPDSQQDVHSIDGTFIRFRSRCRVQLKGTVFLRSVCTFFGGEDGRSNAQLAEVQVATAPAWKKGNRSKDGEFQSDGNLCKGKIGPCMRTCV